MAQVEMLMPKMGESIAEATILKWLKNVGDPIEADESVLEIATDKVDSDVPSPSKGILLKRLFNEGDVVQVGAAIAIIDNEKEESATQNNNPKPAKTEPSVDIPFVPAPKEESIKPSIVSPSINTPADRFYSPLVRNIAQQEGISSEELASIQGTGIENRITKNDLLDYISKRGTQKQPVSKPITASPEPLKEISPVKKEIPYTPSVTTINSVSSSGDVEIIEMDRMRRLIADHMVMSKHTSAHVTSFVEADVTNIVHWRERVKDAFEKREKEKITYTPIFIEAVARAIKDFPMINVSVDGTKIILKKNINIGMATALSTGNLIVPVIKNADQKNLTGLTKTVNDLANRARNNKLSPDDTRDGTFTITNVGTFGNVLGTPIINQPQVAILAVGVIKKKPAVIETPAGDAIAIRHMMFLSLSYDHRVVDGALGGSFLRRVADYLESFDSNMTI